MEVRVAIGTVDGGGVSVKGCRPTGSMKNRRGVGLTVDSEIVERAVVISVERMPPMLERMEVGVRELDKLPETDNFRVVASTGRNEQYGTVTKKKKKKKKKNIAL